MSYLLNRELFVQYIRLMRRLSAVGVFLALLTIAVNASAQVATWSNSANGNWSAGSNWVESVAPISTATTAIVFGAPATQSASYTATNDVADPFEVNSLTFNNTAGMVTLAGSALTFAGANPTITRSGAGSAFINLPVTLASSTTAAGSGTGPLTLNGAIAGGTNNLVKSSDGPLTLAGGGSLNVLELTAGTTNVTAGTLNLNLRDNATASLLLGTAAGQTVVLNHTGGRINFSENARIAHAAGSTATINVTGTGTVFDNTLAGTTGLMRVGGSGAGTLNVTDGGVVNSRNLYVGVLAGSTGEMFIDGAGSTVNSSSMFRVGNSGTGTLTVRNGGTLNAGTVNRSFALIVGNTGVGTLLVSDGGTVASPVAYIGYGGDGGLIGTGTLTVTGPGSSFTLGTPAATGELGIGVTELGTGTLNVQNGGLVTVNGSARGAYFDGRGTINVTDAGSQLRVTGRLSLGGEFSDSPGTATLNVGSGGAVTVVGRAQLQNASAINLDTGGVMSAGSLADGPRNGAGIVNLAAGATLTLTDGTDTFRGTIRGEGALAKVGTGVQTLAGANTYSGMTTVGSGLLRVTGSINSNNAVTIAAPAAFELQGTGSSVGAITGAGATTVGNGALPTTLTASHVRQRALTINAASEVKTKTGGGTSVFNMLSIAGDAAPAATLDLNNNSAIVDYLATVPSPATTVRDQIIAGRGGAGLGKDWTGMGITSSAAAAANTAEPESRSIGFAENSTMPLGPYTTFRGQPADDTSILITFTRTGDANLDGVVNDDDVTIVGASYAPGVPQAAWALGDFDYNGFVDDDDVTLLGAFYDPSAPPPTVTRSASAENVAAVPEPASWLLALGALAVGFPACFGLATRLGFITGHRRRSPHGVARSYRASPLRPLPASVARRSDLCIPLERARK